MPDVGAVVAAAGQGRRLGAGKNKVLLPLGNKPVLVYALRVLEESPAIGEIVVAVGPGEEDECRRLLNEHGFTKIRAVVAGGATRQESVRRALSHLGPECSLVAVHDGARPFASPALVAAVIAAARLWGAAVPGVAPRDTIKVLDSQGQRVHATLPRGDLVAVQTPQVFARHLLEEAHARAAREGFTGTDDASLVERLGYPVRVVPGDYYNLKITTKEDLEVAEMYLAAGLAPLGQGGETGGGVPAGRADAAAGLAERSGPWVRFGLGVDVHPLAAERPLVLAGVTIPAAFGLAGHSDADVLTHAVMDALLGAVALGDIGQYFPSDDPAYAGANSLELLARVLGLLEQQGWQPAQVDATLLAEKPKLAPYFRSMREKLADALGLPPERVSIKATTTERLGFLGRGEGMAALAIAVVARRGFWCP